jgi:formate hydrogenlyase subunit 3/multisubunit Na+/H+ antiporter MnhD subunit
MIAWINFIILLLATVLTVVYYLKSAGPAVLEQKSSPSAYAKCTRYRALSAIFMTLAGINYIVYAFYPIPLPRHASSPGPIGFRL